MKISERDNANDPFIIGPIALMSFCSAWQQQYDFLLTFAWLPAARRQRAAFRQSTCCWPICLPAVCNRWSSTARPPVAQILPLMYTVCLLSKRCLLSGCRLIVGNLPTSCSPRCCLQVAYFLTPLPFLCLRTLLNVVAILPVGRYQFRWDMAYTSAVFSPSQITNLWSRRC